MNTNALLVLAGFLVCGADKLAELKELTAWKAPGKFTWIFQFSPDGRTLVTGNDGESPKVILWDAQTGHEIVVLVGDPREFDRVAFSADGRLVAGASGNSGRLVKVWEIATGKRLHSFAGERSEGIYTLAFSADACSLVAAGRTSVYSWELKDGKQKALFERSVQGWGAVFSPDGKTLASPNYQDLDLWDVRSGKIRRILADHRGEVVGAAFSADGKTVAAAVQRNNGKKAHWEVHLWDAENGKELSMVSCDHGSVRQILLDNKAKTLVVRHIINWQDPESPYELRFYDLSSGREHVSRRNLSKRSMVALSPDGKVLATLESDNQIKVWELPPVATEKER